MDVWYNDKSHCRLVIMIYRLCVKSQDKISVFNQQARVFMSAYMLIIAELDDPKGFRDYAIAAAQLIGKFGGEYIIRGALEVVTLEGEWPEEKKIVMSKWPSMAAAQEFWNSPEYAEVKKLRLGKARVTVRPLDGI